MMLLANVALSGLYLLMVLAAAIAVPFTLLAGYALVESVFFGGWVKRLIAGFLFLASGAVLVFATYTVAQLDSGTALVILLSFLVPLCVGTAVFLCAGQKRR